MREHSADFGFVCYSFTTSIVDDIRVSMEQWRRIKHTDDKVLPVFVVVRASGLCRCTLS